MATIVFHSSWDIPGVLYNGKSSSEVDIAFTLVEAAEQVTASFQNLA
jgi:hypothetical protein